MENIPEQHIGVESNTTHSLTAKNKEEAQDIYTRACERLLNINTWHKLSGTGSADFKLVEKDGNEVYRLAKENDYFKIDIPGPGSVTGQGYDWVKVEKIEEVSDTEQDRQQFSIRVRPSSNPTNIKDDVAHFLSDEATSTFIISRDKNIVTAGVFGRNETPNKNVEKIVDKIRNIIVGSGALAGASKIQWKSLVKGLLADEIPE